MSRVFHHKLFNQICRKLDEFGFNKVGENTFSNQYFKRNDNTALRHIAKKVVRPIAFVKAKKPKHNVCFYRNLKYHLLTKNERVVCSFHLKK